MKKISLITIAIVLALSTWVFASVGSSNKKSVNILNKAKVLGISTVGKTTAQIQVQIKNLKLVNEAKALKIVTKEKTIKQLENEVKLKKMMDKAKKLGITIAKKSVTQIQKEIKAKQPVKVKRSKVKKKS